MCVDPHGNIPFAEGFFDETFQELGKWIYEILTADPNERDLNGQRTLNAAIKQTAILFWENIEVDIGLGQGFYVEGNIVDLISIGLGMYGNYANIKYSDGEWKFGQDLNIGASITALWIFEFGFNEYTFLQDGVVTDQSNWYGINDTKDKGVIFSVSAYFIAGGTVTVSFDLNSFLEELRKV